MGVKRRIKGAVCVGDVSPRATSRSPAIDVGDSRRITVTITGLYHDLATRVPAKGQAWAGYPGFQVDAARLDRRGALADLSVTLEPSQIAGASFEGVDNPELSDLWEADWRPIEKPLLTNKTLTGGTDNPQISQDVEAWRNEPNSVYRLQWKYQSGGTAEDPVLVTLDGVALKTAKKIAKGVESWLAFSPVVVRRRTYRKAVSFGRAGYRDTPAFAPAGLQWLKTGDNLAQQSDKSWLRTETWTGADEWDTDLYPEGA